MNYRIIKSKNLDNVWGAIPIGNEQQFENISISGSEHSGVLLSLEDV